MMLKTALAADPATIVLPPSIPKNVSLDQYANSILTSLLFVVGLIAFISIVYSGLLMITSGGDAAKFAVGRKNLLWSVIGLIVVVLAFWLIGVVLNLSNPATPGPYPGP